VLPIDFLTVPPDTFFILAWGRILARTSTGCLLAGSALGERNKSAETVGKEAANELAKHIQEGGCVDEYLQDQLIIYMALAKGESKVLTGPLSLHTETAIFVAEQMTKAKFTVKQVSATQSLITCEGVGLVNPHYQEFLAGEAEGDGQGQRIQAEIVAPSPFGSSASQVKRSRPQPRKVKKSRPGSSKDVERQDPDEDGEEEEEEEGISNGVDLE